MHPSNRGERQWLRYVHGRRRLLEDRAQHGGNAAANPPMNRGIACDCLTDEALQGRGATFARFADTPKLCSRPFCCGNPRAVEGDTVQEIRGPRIGDWE